MKKGVPEGAVSHADEIVQKSVFRQKEGSCVKNGDQHEPTIIPCDWLFTTPHTPWSLMMIMNPSHTHFDHDHDDVLERLEKSLYQVNALLEQGGGQGSWLPYSADSCDLDLSVE